MPIVPAISPYTRHVAAWKDCERCPLCEKRSKVVFTRGKIPCDVLFIGEAPGKAEDVLGLPFVGPAGHLLDQIIADALNAAGSEVDSGGSDPQGKFVNVWQPADVRVAFTNLVGCIPLDDDGDKTVAPLDTAIIKCLPKLRGFISIAKPKLIVCVGQLASKNLARGGTNPPVVDITHPAAILRADVSQQGLQYQRCVVALSDAISDLVSC